MSSEIRKEVILERLDRDQRVSVLELSAEFGVSGETIRRDLKDLEAEGAVRRVHGGAIPAGRTADTPITERIKLNALEKDEVAGLARSLINDDCVIFLDTGTTTLALARRLVGFKKLRRARISSWWTSRSPALPIRRSAKASASASPRKTPS